MTKPIKEYTRTREEAVKGYRLSQVERVSGGSWIYVGNPTDPLCGPNSPPFTNGGNKGGRFQPLRFRWTPDGGLPQIQGVVAGIAPGDVIFTLPGLYVPDQDGDMPIPGSDPDTGLHVAFEVRANGDVVFVG